MLTRRALINMVPDSSSSLVLRLWLSGANILPVLERSDPCFLSRDIGHFMQMSKTIGRRVWIRRIPWRRSIGVRLGRHDCW